MRYRIFGQRISVAVAALLLVALLISAAAIAPVALPVAQAER